MEFGRSRIIATGLTIAAGGFGLAGCATTYHDSDGRSHVPHFNRNELVIPDPDRDTTLEIYCKGTSLDINDNQGDENIYRNDPACSDGVVTPSDIK